jgi:hypothetical protein
MLIPGMTFLESLEWSAAKNNPYEAPGRSFHKISDASSVWFVEFHSLGVSGFIHYGKMNENKAKSGNFGGADPLGLDEGRKVNSRLNSDGSGKHRSIIIQPRGTVFRYINRYHSS